MASAAQQLCTDFWQNLLNASPQFGTYIGFDEYPDQLDSFALSSFQQRSDFCHTILERIDTITKDGPQHPEDELNLQILRIYTTICLRGLQHKVYLMPVNFLEGPDALLNFLVANRMKFQTLKDFNNYIARLKQFPKQVEECRLLLETGIEHNITAYGLSVEPAIVRLERFTSGEIEDSPFYAPFKVLPGNISSDEKQRLVNEGKELVSTNVMQTLKHFRHYIKEVYMPSCRASLSIKHQPDGTDRYQTYVEFFCDTDSSPQDLHDMGKQEVLRLQREIKQLLRDVDFDGTMQNFHSFLMSQPDQLFQSEEELLKACNDLLDNKIRPSLPKLFHIVPILPLRICTYQGSGTVYNAPPKGNGSPALLRMSSDLKLTPKYILMSLLLHETDPGHHYQACHTVPQIDLPNFRRFKDDKKYNEAPGRFPLNTAYTEGWGLYCEELGNELGLYSDLYDRFGYLEQCIKRAVRLVVNTGIHAFGWSSEQSLEYMMSNAIFLKSSAQREILRYVQWPAEACAYTYGHLKFKELRRKAETELGTSFDIRGFHDACLRCGQVPLQILEDIINKYIQKHKHGIESS